jgi:phage terminase small subunit
MKGRKPVPIALAALHGNPTGLPKRKELPAPPLLEPPDDLSPGQREYWLHAVANAPKGVLKEADRGILRSWAMLEDVLIRASAALGREDLLVPIQGQPFPAISSNWTIANNAQRSLKGIAELLGFAPTARARLAVPAQQAFDPPSDPYALNPDGTSRPTLDEWLQEGERLHAKIAAESAERRAKEQRGKAD